MERSFFRVVWVDRHCCSAEVVILGQLEEFWGGWNGGKILVGNFAPENFGARWNVNSCLKIGCFLMNRFWNRVIEMGEEKLKGFSRELL